MDSERRRFKRFDVSLDVEFKNLKELDKSFGGVTRNFSRSGLCFESQHSGMALQECLELKVKLPGQNSFVPVSGSVAWKEQVKDRYLIGIEFLGIDKEKKSEILDYAYDLWLEESRNMNSV